METKNVSGLFVTPPVQVLELRLPSVAAGLHLKEQIGFLRLSPSFRSGPGPSGAQTARTAGLRLATLQFSAGSLRVTKALRRALIRTIRAFRAERIAILHAEDQPTGITGAGIPRIYLN